MTLKIGWDFMSAILPNLEEEMNGSNESSNNIEIAHPQTDSRLLTELSNEILDAILSFLSPRDLNAVAHTCHCLYKHASDDRFWRPFVQDNVPGYKLKSSYPCSSYRSLYHAHDPRWFVSKGKIWIGDQHLFGCVMITYYNQYRGTIEGYRLVVEPGPSKAYTWDHDQDVNIYSFNPNVRLHMDMPLLMLEPAPETGPCSLSRGRNRLPFDVETPMLLNSPTGTALSTFVLTRWVLLNYYNVPHVWPPIEIPASWRAITPGDENLAGNQDVRVLTNKILDDSPPTGAQKPCNRKQIHSGAFRVRQCMNYIPGYRGQPTQVNTYATLDPALYTPTAMRPFRGIWVADFSSHGCEFFLLHQPDVKVPFDGSTIVKLPDETQSQFLSRERDAQIYRGRLEAIKLTGDPNIPRGKYAFIAEDIGDKGLVRIDDDSQFKGARIVKCETLEAERNFVNDYYVETELILISPDKIAHYCERDGVICFLKRVNLDDFLCP